GCPTPRRPRGRSLRSSPGGRPRSTGQRPPRGRTSVPSGACPSRTCCAGTATRLRGSRPQLVGVELLLKRQGGLLAPHAVLLSADPLLEQLDGLRALGVRAGVLPALRDAVAEGLGLVRLATDLAVDVRGTQGLLERLPGRVTSLAVHLELRAVVLVQVPLEVIDRGVAEAAVDDQLALALRLGRSRGTGAAGRNDRLGALGEGVQAAEVPVAGALGADPEVVRAQRQVAVEGPEVSDQSRRRLLGAGAHRGVGVQLDADGGVVAGARAG